MPEEQQEPKQSDFNPQGKDPETKKRIHEHLSNKADVISKEDIENTKTSELVDDNPNSEVFEKTVREEGSETRTKPEDKKIKDDFDSDIGTSWNILES